MSTPHDPHDSLLAERYGRGARQVRQRCAVVAAGVVVVVALGWLAWVIWTTSAPQAQSRVQGYDVVDDRLSTVDVTVELADASVEASCLVRATAADSSVVGERSFTVTGSTEPRRFTVEVRTERRADVVENVGCTTPDQNRPR